MPFSFPASPTVGQQSTQNGRVYQWTGSAWEIVAIPTTVDAGNLTGTLDVARLPSLPASQIVSGVLATARLGGGSPSASNFLRGDGTWATPSASVSPATTTTLGGVIVPTSGNLVVDGSGNISATLATAAQSRAGSATVFATPARVRDQLAKWKMIDMGAGGPATTSSGGLSDIQTFQARVISQSTANGFAMRSSGNTTGNALNNPTNTSFSSGNNYWAQNQLFAIRATVNVASANGVVRLQIGKSATTAGRLTTAGIGFEFFFVSANDISVRLLAHSGSALTVQDAAFNFSQTGIYDFTLQSDGSGNVSLLVNDGAVGTVTCSGGPTSGGVGGNGINIEASNGGDAASSGMITYRYIFATSY